jgi:putative transposase
MSLHSYSRIWLHLVWTTLNRERMLNLTAAAKLSGFLDEYAKSKGIYLKINFVNPEHVHALIDLPTSKSVEEIIQLFKGASSHWVNEQDLVAGKFAWGRGYGCFSVSQSNVADVAKYIADQAEHHRVKSFAEEFQAFVEKHGLQWHDDKTVETVPNQSGVPSTGLKPGANEKRISAQE